MSVRRLVTGLVLAGGTAILGAAPQQPQRPLVFRTNTELIEIEPAVRRKPLPLTATISALTPDGAVTVTFNRSLSAGHQSSLDISLPLAQLVPGAYRLQVVVTDGAMSDTREIGFLVK